MRIIGGSDYYDGRAVSTDGSVLFLSVFRRTGNRTVARSAMAKTPSFSLRTPRILLRRLGCGVGILQRLRSVMNATLRRDGPCARISDGDVDIRLEAGAAAFCGTLRRCIVVTAVTDWSPRGDVVLRDWCWSLDDLEESLASHGYRIQCEALESWFAPVDVSSTAKLVGFAIASFDPTDGSHAWRLDAPTLDAMNHQHVLPPAEALAELAGWLSGSDRPVKVRLDPRVDVDRDKVALLTA